MKRLEDYNKTIPFPLFAILRDILGELEKQSSEIEGFAEWIEDLDIRLAKLEEEARKP